MSNRIKFFMLCAVLVFLMPAAFAQVDQPRDFLSLSSRFLGNGEFEYNVRINEEPMFHSLKPVFFLVFATNILSSAAPPALWSDSTNNSSTNRTWNYSDGNPNTNDLPILPYQCSFRIIGDSNHYKRARQVFLFGYLSIYDFIGSPIVSENAIFFAKFEALVPCLPQEADGSSPVAYSSFPGGPGIKIDQLGMIDGQIRTVTYRYPRISTVRLQSTTNYVDWSNVTNILGVPPVTTWTSSVPMESFGNAFRLALVAERHLTNLSGFSAEAEIRPLAAGKAASVRSIDPRDALPLAVTIASRKGGRFKVSVEDWTTGRKVVREAVANGETLSVEFPEFMDSRGALVHAFELD